MVTKRLGIYFLEEDTGKTDEYISYMLKNLKKCTSRIVMIVKEPLTEDEKKVYSSLVEEIYIEETTSSFTAYFNALNKLQNIGGYTEIIFCNSKLFGPLYDIETFISDERNLLGDFFGLEQNIYVPNFEGNGSRCLNPDFFILKSDILNDDGFINIWQESLSEEVTQKDDGEEIDIDRKIIGNIITEYLLRSGYVYSPIVKLTENATYIGDTLGIAQKNGRPFISREYIVNDYETVLNNSRGEEIKYVLAYIDKKTDYPYNNIISHLLKIYNIYDIYNSLQLNYILSSDVSKNTDEVLKNKKAVVVIHIFYMDLIEYFSDFIYDIPLPVDIILTTTDEEKGKKLREAFEPRLGNRLRVIVSEGNGRELAALFVETRDIIKNYDYICFTHDKKSPHNNNQSVSRDFQRLIVENVVDTGKYITNVIEAFDKDENLGLLVPPAPLHGGYFASLGRRWTLNFEVVGEFLDSIGVSADLDETKPPLATGSSFWCRKEALLPIINMTWEHEDFAPEPMPSDGTVSHALERCFPFVAQSQGYYTGMIMTLNNASVEFTNREYLLEKLHLAFHNILPTYGQNIGSYLDKIEEYTIEHEKEENSIMNKLKQIPGKIKNRIKDRIDARLVDRYRIKIIRNSKLFDAEWYLNEYEDVGRENFDPASHYYMFGWKEGRGTSEYFSAEEYYKLNPDVKAARVCPLYHYETAGKFEGREYTSDKEKLIDIEITKAEWDGYNKKIKRVIKKEKKLIKNTPIQNNKIVFKTFQQDYTDNPKYICEEILKRDLPYDLVWLCKNTPKIIENFPRSVRIVKDGTLEAKREIASAKILIDNGIHFYNFKELKKKKQISICTWHGSLGFKKLAGNKMASKRNQRSAELYNETNDYVISNSTFEDGVFRESYWRDTEFIECGHPRNDILINSDEKLNEKIKLRVCKKLGINPDKKIALYAPTFREKLVDNEETMEYEDVNYERLVEALKSRFGGEWCVITRVHFVNSSDDEYLSELPDYCYNGTHYPDIQELMIAADMALTDYSSWILDYMFTRKPAFLFTPDYDDYELQRGFCYPLKEAPFMIARDNDELSDNIKAFDENIYRENIERFLIEKGSREDGNGSKKVVDKINQITGIGI